MEKNLDETVKRRMNTIAKKIDDELPDGQGFCVLAFSFGDADGRQLMYASNADRLDIIKAMQEWIDKTKDTFGNDTGKY